MQITHESQDLQVRLYTVEATKKKKKKKNIWQVASIDASVICPLIQKWYVKQLFDELVMTSWRQVSLHPPYDGEVL